MYTNRFQNQVGQSMLKPFRYFRWVNGSELEKRKTSYAKQQFKDISEHVKDIEQCATEIGVHLDGSWNSRGWSARIGIINVCFEETGKMLDVILKTFLCNQCSQKNKEKEKRLLNVV